MSSQAGVVDAHNREFYGRFPYPWPALVFEHSADRRCGAAFLNQELGIFEPWRVPPDARIWVAGCGTNQAIFTALRFPDAEVLGTDLSARALAIAETTAARVGVRNLRLEERTLLAPGPADEFDYIICTGVIHHTADPGLCLAHLRRALRRDGILELMVYNAQHRALITSYQQAVRTLIPGLTNRDLEAQLSLTRDLIARFPMQNSMQAFLHQYETAPEARIADALLQPLEQSFTVGSLAALLQSAGWDLLLPCVNQFDASLGHLTWHLPFADETAARLYAALPDVARWHVSNLLMVERAPMLWFYAQRSDATIARRSEQEISAAFLGTRFHRYTTKIVQYARDEDTYRLLPTPVAYPNPPAPQDDELRRIHAHSTPDRSMGEVFAELAIAPTFAAVNRARVQLTTPLFPFLRAESFAS